MFDYPFDQSFVGRWKLILAQARWVDPDGLLTFQSARFALQMLAQERVQMHLPGWVIMPDRLEGVDGRARMSNSSRKLARQALLQCLARLAFAAGEFPASAERIAGPAPADQHLRIPTDDPDGDDDCSWVPNDNLQIKVEGFQSLGFQCQALRAGSVGVALRCASRLTWCQVSRDAQRSATPMLPTPIALATVPDCVRAVNS